MSWVRLDDGFPEHRKTVAAGGDAAWLLVCAIAYCNRNENDGIIPRDVLSRLSDRRSPRRLAARLVEVGLWELHPDGWLIHDYLKYQPSRAQRDAERAAARERMARNRGSPNVQANGARSSGEQDAKFERSSPYPGPGPLVGFNPLLDPSGLLTAGNDEDDQIEPWRKP